MRSSARNANRKFNKKSSRLGMILLLGTVLAALIILLPKTPVVMAVREGAGSTSSHSGLRITEVISDNASAVPDEHGKFGDVLEVTNTTDEAMNLKDVGLSDRSDRIRFLFPEIVLDAGESVIVFCDGTNASDAGNVLHAKFKLSSYGETLFLFDSNGVAIDMVTVPTLNADESYLLNENGEYEVSSLYSPGFPNTEAGHREYLAHYSIPTGNVVLNEIMPSPRSGLRDEDGDLSDWVELRNLSGQDIRLGTLALSDDPQKPVKWVFPQDAVLPAYGYYLVFCSGKDKIESSTLYPHTSFSIRAESETIVLSTVTGELLDRVTVENIGKDMTYGRDPETLNWQVYTLGTPGLPNDMSGMNRADEYLRAVNPTGVYISEVMSSADTVTAIAGEDSCDFVELYNSSDVGVDLSGFGLSDNVNWPRKWTFPNGTWIYPGEYKVILLDKSQTAGSDASRLHASFALARTGGEMMSLSDAQGNVLDRVYLPEIPCDTSYGRTLGSSGFFYYDPPTPGYQNGSGFSGFVAAPVISMQSGLYEGKIEVEITAQEGASIRYTLDGSIPTIQNSSVYEGPLTVATTTVLRARAFSSGLEPSQTVSASYIMNTYHTLDVVSIIIDPYELYNEETGLFTVGENAVRDKIPYKNTIYRAYGKIARPAYVDVMLQAIGEAVISQGAKMDLMGDYSLDMPQKSLKIRANSATGSKYFEYPLFEDRDYTYYKSFTLRNSGNDCVWTRVADGLQTRLIEKYIDTDILTLAWKPVVVYINGDYFGHYNMRERKDEYCIAQHEGIPMEEAKNIAIMRASSKAVQGSRAEYLEMRETIANSSPNTDLTARQFLDDHIDIDSYLDWFAIKMFFGDSDPGNIMFYCVPGGKWKCLIFDLDYGLFNSSFNSPRSYMKESGMGEQKINNVIFRKILEVDEYRDLFFTKLGNIFKTLTPSVMQAELDACIALIEPEMPIHFERWAQLNDKNINSDSPLSADGAMRYWKERIRRMREETIPNRPYRLYGFVQEEYGMTDEEMFYYFGERPAQPE